PLQGVPADELAGFQRTFNFLVDAVAEKEKELERLAATDDLTGLFNHRSFVRDLEALHEAAAPFAVLMCDLDNLKLLNDARGHLAGDRLLQMAAATIGRAVAGRGTAYRYGGDEFAVLLPGADAAAAAAVAGRIRREVADLALPEEPDPLFCATISIGSATFPEDGRNGAELVANADRALAAAKQRGRNQVVPYDPELETFAPVGAEAHTSLLMDVIRSLAAVVDVRDQYTGSHSEQVGELASRLGQAAGLSPRQCFYLRIAGLLHDCGKIGLPDTVLRKQGPLTPDEQVLVRQHPVLSGRIVQHLRTLEIIRPWVIHHHERYDGTGYPEGLQGEAIPLEARILAIADAYHAMVSHRPCRPALSEEMACEELQAQRGRQFDPRLVDIFLARVLPARAAEAG
ncbi:MAG: HD domain-containing phosphohydrolase, partial [Bacillota bacterium]